MVTTSILAIIAFKFFLLDLSIFSQLDPTPTPIACVSQFVIGDKAEVISGSDGSVFSTPDRDQRAYFYVMPGDIVEVLDAPVCTAYALWIQIEFNERIGWFQEYGAGFCSEIERDCAPNYFVRKPRLAIPTLLPQEKQELYRPDPRLPFPLAPTAIGLANVKDVDQLRQFNDADFRFLISSDDKSILFTEASEIRDTNTGELTQKIDVEGSGLVTYMGESETAVLMDYRTDNLVKLNLISGEITSVTSIEFCGHLSRAISLDGSLIACHHNRGKDHEVLVVNLETLELVHQFQQVFYDGISRMIFSADNRLLLTIEDVYSESEYVKRARLWELNTGNLLHDFEIHADTGKFIYDIVYSPDGAYIAWLLDDSYPESLSEVQIYDLLNSELMTLPVTQEDYRALQFNVDASLIFIGTENGAIDVWDVENATLLTSFNGHTDAVWNLELNSDGTQLYSSSFDNTLRVWGLPEN